MIGRTPRRDLDEVLEETASVWSALDGATVLLTGATGFVGGWLLDSLAHAREETGATISVIVSARSEARFRARFEHLAGQPWLTVHESDVRALDLRSVNVDFAVHAASAAAHAALAENPFEVHDLIVRGTRRALEGAAMAGAQRTLLVSSGSVYGGSMQRTAPIAETDGAWTDPVAPSQLIVESKRTAEALGSEIAQRTGMQVITARGFGMSGPWLPLDGAFAFGNFIRDALNGRAITLTGNGSPVRSYLYGSDVASWLWQLLVGGSPGLAYNVGSEQPIRLLDLAQAIADRTGSRVDCPLADRPSAPDYFVPDTSRARTLSLRSRVDVAQAIDRMIEWHRGLSPKR